MKEVLGENKYLLATLDKDTSKTEEEALFELYRRLRPGEPPTVDSAKSLINTMFFDPRRYDLSNVGRYKFNKKLALAPRIAGKTLAQVVVDPLTGEILADDIDQLGNRRIRSRRRAAAEPVPHRLLPHGARHPRAHDAAGSGSGIPYPAVPDQHPSGRCSDQGVLRFLRCRSSWTRPTRWPS
jgi:hypothetical protein